MERRGTISTGGEPSSSCPVRGRKHLSRGKGGQVRSLSPFQGPPVRAFKISFSLPGVCGYSSPVSVH